MRDAECWNPGWRRVNADQIRGAVERCTRQGKRRRRNVSVEGLAKFALSIPSAKGSGREGTLHPVIQVQTGDGKMVGGMKREMTSREATRRRVIGSAVEGTRDPDQRDLGYVSCDRCRWADRDSSLGMIPFPESRGEVAT